ncbi:MAG: hypothetical protein ACLFV3_03110 [Phycisphaeraceae bacterium]
MIVYCCPDLIFATKIRATAESLGLTTRPARDLQALRNRLNQVDDGRANEPVSAVLVDLELEDAAAFIREAKDHDPAITVVACGPHVGREAMAAARDAGADAAMPRSAFAGRLPELLEELREGV